MALQTANSLLITDHYSLNLSFTFQTQVIYISSFIDYSAATIGDYVFPPWAEAIGWFLTMTSVIVMIVHGIVLLYISNGSFIEVS